MATKTKKKYISLDGLGIAVTEILNRISGIQTQLDNKAAKTHTHSVAISGGATAEAVSAGTSAASLNVTKVSTSVLAVPSGDTLVIDGNF